MSAGVVRIRFIFFTLDDLSASQKCKFVAILQILLMKCFNERQSVSFLFSPTLSYSYWTSLGAHIYTYLRESNAWHVEIMLKQRNEMRE